MSKQSVDDLLQQGIHGAKQIKPEERRKFLGTLRERVVVALSQGEVRKKLIDPEMKRLLAENPEAHLYLNGNMEYSFLSKFIKEAESRSIAYTLVTNKEHDTEYGLVLAYDHAIDKEDISLPKTKKVVPIDEPAKTGILAKFKTLFGKK